MNRQNNAPFNTLANPNVGPPVYKQLPTGRIPQNFKEAMLHIPAKPAANPHIRTSDMAVKTQAAQKPAGKPSFHKWKSSFIPLEDEEDTLDQSPGTSQRVDIYDPYNPLSSDSENEVQDHNPSLPDHDDDLDHFSTSGDSHKKRRWGSCYSESLSHALDSHDLSPENGPSESRGPSPGHRVPERQAYSPNAESLDRPGYDSISRPLDHRVCSPDRFIPSSSARRFPASYGGQGTNGEERMIIPEYDRQMTTTVRLSPPRVQRDYQHQSKYTGIERDQIRPSPEVSRNRKMMIIMDKCPITCDLCDVELSSGRELEDHLESKSHWDTLEYIQQQNNYDDLVIAFLQEVMLHKSHQCSRAIEDGALQALQENDHMTKIEMFQCAACSVFVSTSASSVHAHITSQEHLSNTKEFQVQQRRSCLEKAETIMKELKPEFEDFLKGGGPFE